MDGGIYLHQGKSVGIGQRFAFSKITMTKFFLYDWGGWNGVLFQVINHNTPSIFMPLAWIFSNLLGNYWGAPLVILGLWVSSRLVKDGSHGLAIRNQIVQFAIAFGLTLAIATVLKLLYDFPRPPAVDGNLIQGIPADWHYSLPSGHSTYAALVAGVLWPLVGLHFRFTLVLYVILVGWSRIAIGMHFPADVLAGWIIGFSGVAMTKRLLAGLPAINNTIKTMPGHVWYVLASIVLLVDQSSKSAVVYAFAFGEQIRVTSFLNLVHITNDGAAFSLLANAGGWQRYVFILLALGASAWMVRKLRQDLPFFEAMGFSLILGGALGNVVDRILRGAVVDLLDFYWQAAHWPSFNLADVAIFLGVICLFASAINQPGNNELEQRT